MGVMAPEVRMDNRTEKRISFDMELGGKVVGLGVCRIGCVEAKKIIKVSQRKILKYSHRHQSSWKIRVLVDGKCSGLVIKPIHLLTYTWIVFCDELVDGLVVLKAKGLRTREKSSRILQQLIRWSFGISSKRHRGCRVLEEMYGLEDIGEARVKDEGTRSEMEYYSLEYQQPLNIDNMKVADLSTACTRKEFKQWENAIVGYIAAEDMKDYDITQFVRKHWENFGSFKIHVLKPQFFLFEFTNKDDTRKLLEHGHWFVCSRPFILKRWTPNLQLDPSFFISTLPVWVRFPDLDLECWSSLFIARIASVIGKPLFTDELTAKITSVIGKPLLNDELTALNERPPYARVCIEVNPMEELPNDVPIWCDAHNLTFNQRVEYEWTPELCRHCQSLLHDSSTCIFSPTVAYSPNADSCEQLGDEDKVLQSFSPVPDGIHGAQIIYDFGNVVNDLTDEADAQTDTNISISTSGSNAIQELSDINSTTMELSEDEKNSSATARLLSSGRSVSKRWIAYSKQKAMSFVGTTNTWIEIICES